MVRQTRLKRDCSAAIRQGSPVARMDNAELAAAGARHIALVCEVSQQRGFGHDVAGKKELPSKPHTALEEVGVRR